MDFIEGAEVNEQELREQIAKEIEALNQHMTSDSAQIVVLSCAAIARGQK